MTVECRTTSPDETRELGRRLGEACRGGEVLLLIGDLGAGKTCLVQGLARGLGVPPGVPVTSPTFVLHTQYRGRLELEHLDAYRLRDAVDVGSLGFEDCFTPQSVVAIEWPEFLGDVLPAEHLAVTFELGGADERLLRLAARPAGAPAAAPLLAAAREHPGAQPPSDAPA